MISIVALMCHGLLCHEVIVGNVEASVPTSVCGNIAALAEWKGQSPYAGDDWYIKSVRCAPGKPVVRDEI